MTAKLEKFKLKQRLESSKTEKNPEFFYFSLRKKTLKSDEKWISEGQKLPFRRKFLLEVTQPFCANLERGQIWN